MPIAEPSRLMSSHTSRSNARRPCCGVIQRVIVTLRSTGGENGRAPSIGPTVRDRVNENLASLVVNGKCNDGLAVGRDRSQSGRDFVTDRALVRRSDQPRN